MVNTGRPGAVVPQELGIVEQTLGNRVTAYVARHEGGDEALSEAERAELLLLQEELAAKSNFRIKRVARLIDMVRSGLSARLVRKPSERAKRLERIDQKLVCSTTIPTRCRVRRNLADLRDEGEVISRKKVVKKIRRPGFWVSAHNGGERRRSSTGRTLTRSTR